MSDRYSYIARIVYQDESEYDEYFDSEEAARDWAEIQDLGVIGYQILRMDWYYHSEIVIYDEWYD